MKIPLVLFSLLTPIATLPAFAAPVKAPITAPQKGEMALQGRIVALDVVKNTIVLRVVAFTNAGGKSSKLPVAKQKLISVPLTTAFFDGSGKLASLGDLDKNEEIVAVGREGAGQFLARLVVWQAREVIERDSDTPPEIAPLLPAPQRAINASLRPVDAIWTPKGALYPGGYKNPMPTFSTLWKLWAEAPGGTDEYGNPLQRSSVARLIKISGPKGEPLDVIRPNTSDPSQTGVSELRLLNDDIDPRWPFLNFEWELRDPQVSAAATGRFSSELEWDNLDFPQQGGGKIDIGRDVTSANGTVIRLVSITRATGGQPQTTRPLSFDFRIVRGAKAPDAQVRLALLDLSDGKGNQYPSSGGTSYGGDNYTLSTRSTPPDDAGKVKLRVRLIETAASLQDRSKYKSLKFQVPVQSIWKARPIETKAKPPIVAESAQLKVQMEGASYDSSNFTATLWVENKDNSIPKEGDWRYLLHTGTVLNAAGKETKIFFPVGDDKKRFVRENGEIAAPNLRNLELQANISGAAQGGGPLDFSLNFERARRLRHLVTFRDIPLPVSNQIQTLKADQIGDDYFEVRRVVRYNDGQVFVGLPDAAKANVRSGAAIVIEFSPLFPQAELQFQVSSITDANGRVWDTNNSNVYAGDSTIAGDRNPRIRTVFLPGLNVNVKQVTLELSASEMQWEGTAAQTLKFRVP